ncbi:GapA-binding peptide SR1P [Bacillus sp. CECT 9360]|nr:GapA-binding peptide SR1P [Bacillus sp. CECT 9360]
MGTIVCQQCNVTMDHYEDEKVNVLYSNCGCGSEDHTEE